MNPKPSLYDAWIDAALIQRGPGGTRWPALAPLIDSAPLGLYPDHFIGMLTRAARAGQIDAVAALLKLDVQPFESALLELSIQISRKEEVDARLNDPTHLNNQLACAHALMVAGAQINYTYSARTPLDYLLDAELAPGAELLFVPLYDAGWRCASKGELITPEQSSWLKAWEQNKPLFSLALQVRGVAPPAGPSPLMIAALSGAPASTQTALNHAADPEISEVLNTLNIAPLQRSARLLSQESESLKHALTYALLEAASLTRRLTPARMTAEGTRTSRRAL